MRAETDDGCSCPRCHDHIREEFYCCNCGYVPNWRQMAYRHEGGVLSLMGLDCNRAAERAPDVSAVTGN